MFLDRDGVINRAIVREGRPSAPARVEDVELLPGAAEAIAALRQAGFRVIVVTNQPDVGAGTLRREVVEAMHERLRRMVPVDDIAVCYHVDQDGCGCRKPKPGMLVEAAAAWGLDLGRSVMVGDRWRDIEAGRAAGCRTIWVRSDYDERTVERPDAVVASLVEAGALIRSGWNGLGDARGQA